MRPPFKLPRIVVESIPDSPSLREGSFILFALLIQKPVFRISESLWPPHSGATRRGEMVIGRCRGLMVALASLHTTQPRAGLRPSLAAARHGALLLAGDAAGSMSHRPFRRGEKGR